MTWLHIISALIFRVPTQQFPTLKSNLHEAGVTPRGVLKH